MFGIPLLSLAWWGAKLLGAKDAATRLINKDMGKAVAIAAAAVVVLVVTVASAAWVVRKIETGAVAGWQSKFVLSRYVATLRERKAQRDADARAAAERQVLVEQLRETAEHASTLEQALAAQAQNPVCFTAAVTKELRK